MLYNSPTFSIYFGNASDALFQSYYLNLPPSVNLAHEQSFARAYERLQSKQLIFLRQIHSVQGLVVNEQVQQHIQPFSIEGDFLVTDLPHIGLGVMTADCLPIVLVDEKKNAIAIVHAGWKGAVNNIVGSALACLRKTYGTHATDLQIFFGPVAKSCCYEVSPDFIDQYAHKDTSSFEQRGGQWFFDVPHFCKNQLIAAGLEAQQIITDYNICTMCDTQYFSHRRQKEKAGRQMTVAILHRNKAMR